MGLFSLSGQPIRVMAQCGARLCHKLRAAALDEIACFRKNGLENIHELAQSGLTIDEVGCRSNEIGICLAMPCGAQRACCRFVFHNARCHTTMLIFLAPECKGYPPQGYDTVAAVAPELLFPFAARGICCPRARKA